MSETKPTPTCPCCGDEIQGLKADEICPTCRRGRHTPECKRPDAAKAADPRPPEKPTTAQPTPTAAPSAPSRPPAPAPASPVGEPGGDDRPTQETRVSVAPKEATLHVRQPPIAVGERGLQMTSLETWVRLAKYAITAGYAPGMNLEQAIAAMQFGAEVGLSPFQSLSAIAVINGKPALYGDGAKAVVEASGELEDSDDWFEHGGKRLAPGVFPVTPDDTTTAFAMVKRKGRKEKVRSFSVADAKRAGLWGKTINNKPTPWVTYPQRMLMARAMGFAQRDAFSDALKGFFTEAEARDYIEVEPIPEPRRLSESKTETSAS